MKKDNTFLKKDSVFQKIKNSFKNKKQINEEVKQIEKNTKKEQTKDKENFSEELNSQTKLHEMERSSKIQEILEIINDNPKVLDNLTVDKLKVIDSYYDEKIQEVNEEINKLKSNMS